MKPVVYFATSNRGKDEELRRVMRDVDVSCIMDMDVVEIQGAPTEIARAKLFAAYGKFLELDLPTSGPTWLAVEDTCLETKCLGVATGPYIRHILDAIGAEGIYQVAKAVRRYHAVVRCTIAFMRVDLPTPQPVYVRDAIYTGTITAPRGAGGFGWDPIFQPTKCGKTYAELDAIGPREKDAYNPRIWAAKKMCEVIAP